MKVFSLLLALALGALVNALPERRGVAETTTSTAQSPSTTLTSTSSSASATPLTDSSIELIVDPQGQCLVRFKTPFGDGESNPMGPYDPILGLCYYKESSHQTNVPPKSMTVDMEFLVDQPDVLSFIYRFGNQNPGRVNFPLGRKRGCRASAKLQFKGEVPTVYVDPGCAVSLDKFRALYGPVAYYPGTSAVETTIAKAPSATPQPSTDPSATPPAIFSHGPAEASVYFGIYKDGNDCKVWAQDFAEIGSARFSSPPVGTFDSASQKCVSAGKTYRVLDLGGYNSFVVWFQADKTYGAPAGLVYFNGPAGNLKLPVGLKDGCQSWWDRKSNQMWSDPKCEVDLKMYDTQMGADIPDALTWTP